MKPVRIGYTTGVWDLFHHGHLNILKKAKEQCDYLIVGVSTDELVQSYKNKKTSVPHEERMAILHAIRYVDRVVPQETMDKYAAWEKLQFNIIFHGDDIKNKGLWAGINKLKEKGIEIVLIPYTKGISTTERTQKIQQGEMAHQDNPRD